MPEIERKLAAEIEATLDGRDAPTFDDLDRMTYLNAFVKEVRPPHTQAHGAGRDGRTQAH